MGRKSFVSPVSDPSRLPKTKTNNSQQQAENDDEGQNDNQIENNVNHREEEQETDNKQTTNIDDNDDNDQSSTTTTAIASAATTTDHVENDENNDGEEKESSSSSPPSTESSATEQQEESSSPTTTTTTTATEAEEEEESSSSTGIEFEDEEDDYEPKTSESEQQKNKDSSKKKRKRSSKTSPENESDDNEEQQEDEEEEDEDYQADEIMGDEDEQKSKSNKTKKKRTSKRLNKKQKTSSEDDNEEEEGESDDAGEKKKKKRKKGKKSSSSSTPADYDEEDDVSSSSARASSSVIADDEDEAFSASSESRRSGNSEFAQVLERIKTKRHTTGELTQIDDEAARLADDLIAKMSFAIEQDKISMQNRQPAMAKLSMLSEVQKAASKVYLQQPLLDRDFLAILANWLTPPHKQLPNINIRNAVLDILTKLPIQGDKHSGKRSRDNEEHEDDGITKELIEKTIGITRAVGMLASHPKETIDNKKKAKYLIERWKRLLYELPDDYSQFSVPVVHRDRTPRPSATSLNQKVRLSEEEEAKIRTSTRARTPQRINFDFQKRPPNRLEDKDGSSSAFANPTHQSLEKKFAKKRR